MRVFTTNTMKTNLYLQNIKSIFSFGGKSEDNSLSKKKSAKETLPQLAKRIFEDEYQASSKNLACKEIKHNKPVLKLIKDYDDPNYASYSVGSNSITLNTATLGNIMLANHPHWSGGRICTKKWLSDYLFMRSDMRSTVKKRALRQQDVELVLGIILGHELQHFEQAHKVLASKNAKEKFCKEAKKQNLSPTRRKYLFDFKPEVKFNLGDKIHVPLPTSFHLKPVSLNKLMQGFFSPNYYNNATEILARANELKRIEKKLKEKTLDAQQREVLLSLKNETINILKDYCIPSEN